MPHRLNATRTAATLIIRHGDGAAALAAREVASAEARGEAGAVRHWREIAEAVRAITGIAGARADSRSIARPFA